jgi:2',3'-cyclic-nucleotide 2'-phosphodiesterase (5'-nucleotidase family)
MSEPRGLIDSLIVRVAFASAAWMCLHSDSSLLAAAPGEKTAAAMTADTEGHVGPCQDCPYHPGLGGLTRRATKTNQLRNDNPSLLLVDAGNAFIGPESLDSRGKVIVAAYNALGYDAVNLSHRDFWFGKTQTLALLKEAKFAAISANLLDQETGEPLVRPYVVKKVGSERIALIGVAQPPAGLEFLPHLKERLAGIRIQPPMEALDKWLPKAKAESDSVILLFYGTPAGLLPVREKFGSDFAAILVGGTRPENLPSDAKPPVIGTSNHGRHLAKIQFANSADGTKVEVTQLAIEPTIAPDAAMEKLLADFAASIKR